MSFFDMFKGHEAPAQQQAEQQAGYPNDVHQQQNIQNQKNSQDGKMPGTDQEPVNPLDAYAKMFERAQTEPDVPPSFQLDPKVLSDVSSNLNFTQDVPQELMQQAMSGDVQALMQIMNRVGQKSYQAALSHSSTLTDKFVGARAQHEMKNLNPMIRKELTNSALSSTPNYSHPVVKEQLNRTAESLQAQYPEARPEQIAQMAAKYIQDLAAAINPQSAQSQSPKADEPVDWSKYLG